MARVRDIEIDEVPADLQPVYRRYAESYGPFLNQVKVFAHRGPALRHVMGMLLELADEAVLPKRYLEIALVTVSRANECTYCVAHHAPRLVGQGLDPASVAAILDPRYRGSTRWTPWCATTRLRSRKMRGGCRPRWWSD